MYRACSLLSDAAAARKPQISQTQDSGGTKVVANTAAARTLATLAFADAEMFAFSTALFGNGYLRIVRDGTGAPSVLEAIPTWRVSIEFERNARRVWYRIASDESLDELEALLPAEDVVHAKYRTIGGNRLGGVPPMSSCSPALGLALQARETQRSLFSNLAMPRTVISAPVGVKISPDVAEKMQAAWSLNYSGEGIGKTAVLGQGMEAKAMQYNAVEAQLLESVNASVLDVARAYGIPQQFLESEKQQTFASAQEGTRALYATALSPFFARLSDALEQKLLTRLERASGTSISYDATDMLLLPGNEMADFLSKLANAGIASPNELRNRYLGLEDVDGGDLLRAPVNSAPIDRWSKGEIAATTPVDTP